MVAPIVLRDYEHHTASSISFTCTACVPLDLAEFDSPDDIKARSRNILAAARRRSAEEDICLSELREHSFRSSPRRRAAAPLRENHLPVPS
jgi:hypothetical protein